MEEQIILLQDQIAKLKVQLQETQEAEETQKTKLKFTKILYRGVKDEEVKTLQEFLKKFPDIYPEGLVTGYFGSLTETAIKRFQAQYGIDPTGTVGPKTRQKLNELIFFKPTSEPIAEQKLKWEEVTGKPIGQKCADGTPNYQCSFTKPRYCEDGNLRNNCSLCECNAGYDCQQDGECANIQGLLEDLLTWAKERNIALVGVNTNLRGTFEPVKNIIPITDVPHTEKLLPAFKKLPAHLLRYLDGMTFAVSNATSCGPMITGNWECYYLKSKDCKIVKTESLSVWPFSETSSLYGGRIPPKDPSKNSYILNIGPKPSILLCGLSSFTLFHEIGHQVDFAGIRLSEGTANALGKTIEEIRIIADEYERIFTVPAELKDSATTPPGYLSSYSTLELTANFADHFAFFIDSPDLFRERVASDSLLAEKYNFLKTKVFLGQEY